MKKRFIRLFSYTMSLILIFLSVAPVTASAIDGGSLELCQSGEMCEATEKELAELKDFLTDFFTSVVYKDFWVDGNILKYDYCIENYMASPSGYFPLYERYFGEIPTTDGKVLSQINSEIKRELNLPKDKEISFYKYDLKKIDWIFRNIFNMPYVRFNWFNPANLYGENYFFYDDSYYVLKDDSKKYKPLTPNIFDIEKKDNNKYTFGLCFYIDGVTTYKYMVVSLREFKDERLWTVHFLGNKSGLYEASMNDDMEIYVDNNSFTNTGTDFISIGERNRYYATKNALSKLTLDKKTSVSNMMREHMIGGWRGAEYGISASMALFFKNKIDKNLLNSENKNTYSDLKEPVNDLGLRDIIHYLQLSQYSVGNGEILGYNKLIDDDESKISEVLKRVCAEGKKNEPFLIKALWKNESGLIANTFVAFKMVEEENSFKITAIDPDNKYKHIYFEISKDYKECVFKDSFYDDCAILSLGVIPLTSSHLIGENTPFALKSDRTLISFIYGSNMKIQNSDGKSFICQNGEFSGDMDFRIENIISNGSNYLCEVMISVPNSEKFTVLIEDDMTDITISSNNGIFCGVEGSNIDKITVSQEKILVEGKDIDYSVSALSSEDDIYMVNLRGSESRQLQISHNEETIVKSERKQTVRIGLLGTNDEFYECDYFPQSNSYKIDLQLVIDNINEEKTNHIKVIIFFISFAFIMFITTGIIIYLVMRDRMKNKK